MKNTLINVVKILIGNLWLLITLSLLNACNTEKEDTKSSKKAIGAVSPSLSKMDMEELERKYQQKIDSILNLQAQKEKMLQNELADLKEKASELKSEKRNFTTRIDDQHSSIQTSDTKIKALAAGYQQKIDSILGLQSQSESILQNELETLRKKAKDLETRNAILENRSEEKASAPSQVAVLEENYQLKIDSISEFQSQYIASLQTKLKNQANDIDQLMSSNADLNKELDQKVIANKAFEVKFRKQEGHYQQKIDSLLSLLSNNDSVLPSESISEESPNHFADPQEIPEDDALDLQPSPMVLQGSPFLGEEEKNNSFNPVALTEESLDSLITSTGGIAAEKDPAFEESYNSFGSVNETTGYKKELDSLILAIDNSENQVSERDQRIDKILAHLAITIEPKSQSAGQDYEKVIINTLLTTVSDDPLIVNQYQRGFYSKQDLIAMVSDYRIRKKQPNTPGEIKVYRRKKNQDPRVAVITVNGKKYSLTHNQIETIPVDDVFNVTVCRRKRQCRDLAFSNSLDNYVEISLKRNQRVPEVKIVDQVAGEFYTRQVASSKK